MSNYRRKEIETFCLNLFNGDNKPLYEVISNYKHMIKDADIQELNLSQEIFNISFQRVCTELFKMRPAKDEYIVALLVYAFNIHEYHKKFCQWYSYDMVVNSLTNVLEENHFNPQQFCMPKPNYTCILL